MTKGHASIATRGKSKSVSCPSELSVLRFNMDNCQTCKQAGHADGWEALDAVFQASSPAEIQSTTFKSIMLECQ